MSRDLPRFRVDGADRAPPLVLVGSLGTSLAMWDPLLDQLTERFMVIRYDLPGHGRSPSLDAPLSVERLGRQVLAVLDEVGLERAAYCGLSLGGLIGQWMAVNAPERLEALVVCAASTSSGTPEMWRQRADAVRRGGIEAIAAASLERWFTERFRVERPDQVAWYDAMLRAVAPESYAACCEAIGCFDFASEAPSIAVPTLVVAGRHDEAVPPSRCARLAEAVPNAEMVVLGGAHLLTAEAPRELAAAVRGHLCAAVPRRTRTNCGTSSL